MLSPLNIVSLDQGKLYGQKPDLDELYQRLIGDVGQAHDGSLLAEDGLVKGQAASGRVVALFSHFMDLIAALARRLQPMP
jgi:hypothetical protein